MTPALIAALLTISATRAVTFQVVDARDGKPLPCRVSIRGADGSWYFPEPGRPGAVVPYRRAVNGRPRSVEMHATVSAEPFVARLPDGEYEVMIEHGKEFHAIVKTVSVGESTSSFRFELKRWFDAAARGWYSGDTHAHRSLDELPNLVSAEDLNIAFPMTYWVREAGATPPSRRPKDYREPPSPVMKADETHLIVTRNTEYELFTVAGKSHMLGAFFVLGHQRPLDLGAPPVGPVAKAAHEQGALIDLDKHNWPWSMAVIPVMPVDLFELANNHVWRTEFAFGGWAEKASAAMNVETDANGFTEKGWIDFGFKNYYALLNCGFRLRPTAGTGSGVHPVPLGFGRVYVHLDRPFTAENWIAALDEGNGFVTTGPMVFAAWNDRPPGKRPYPSRAGEPIRLRGTCESPTPLSRIEIVRNGEVIDRVEPTNRPTETGGFRSDLTRDIPNEESCWLVVRCFQPIDNGRERFAHTAPFYVEVPGKPIRPRKFEVDYLVDRVRTQIERSRGVISEAALDEYRQALSAYEKLRESAR